MEENRWKTVTWADLSYTNLGEADLTMANLSYADLEGSNPELAHTLFTTLTGVRLPENVFVGRAKTATQ